MPDYAEVAGCSTFKNPTSPLYDSCGAYATTNLVKNANIFTNNFHNNNKNSIYSAPTSCHYNVDDRDGVGGGGIGGGNNSNSNTGMGHSFAYSESNFPTHNNKATKMNIIENKMDMINNLNRSSSSASVPMNGYGGGVIGVGGMKCGSVGTIRRNRLPKLGHCDKISFGGSENGRTLEQPLFVKSKEDGSWTTVQNSTYHFQGNSNSSDNHNSNSKINFSGNNVYGGGGLGGGSGGSGYLSSFGKSDNV